MRPALLPEIAASLLAIALASARPVMGSEEAWLSFYKRGQEGWFWYRENQWTEEETRTETLPAKEIGSGGGKPMFSAAWLRENLPKFRDLAIDNPAPENVAAYFALQRVALDKAERFARTAKMLPLLYPALDENARRPIATAAAYRMDSLAAQAEDELLRRIAGFAGIFFFFQSDCHHCIAQASVLKALENQYGFKILPVSVDGMPLISGDYPQFQVDQDQSRVLGVTVTPAMFLVNPDAAGNGRIQLIGQGEMALSQVRRRILDAAFEAGWIDRQSYEKTLPLKPLYLEPKDGTDESPESILKTLGIARIQSVTANPWQSF